MVVKSNSERNHSSNYNIKKISKHNISSNYNHTNLNKNNFNKLFNTQVNQGLGNNNLNKFNFKVTNKNEIKNFSMFENFLKNDIINKNTNKKLSCQTLDYNKSKNNITGEPIKCIEDRKKSEVKKHYYETCNQKTVLNLHKENPNNITNLITLDNPCEFNFPKTRGNIKNFNCLKRKKHFVNNFFIIDKYQSGR